MWRVIEMDQKNESRKQPKFDEETIRYMERELIRWLSE